MIDNLINIGQQDHITLGNKFLKEIMILSNKIIYMKSKRIKKYAMRYVPHNTSNKINQEVPRTDNVL